MAGLVDCNDKKTTSCDLHFHLLSCLLKAMYLRIDRLSACRMSASILTTKAIISPSVNFLPVWGKSIAEKYCKLGNWHFNFLQLCKASHDMNWGLKVLRLNTYLFRTSENWLWLNIQLCNCAKRTAKYNAISELVASSQSSEKPWHQMCENWKLTWAVKKYTRVKWPSCAWPERIDQRRVRDGPRSKKSSYWSVRQSWEWKGVFVLIFQLSILPC